MNTFRITWRCLVLLLLANVAIASTYYNFYDPEVLTIRSSFKGACKALPAWEGGAYLDCGGALDQLVRERNRLLKKKHVLRVFGEWAAVRPRWKAPEKYYTASLYFKYWF